MRRSKFKRPSTSGIGTVRPIERYAYASESTSVTSSSPMTATCTGTGSTLPQGWKDSPTPEASAYQTRRTDKSAAASTPGLSIGENSGSRTYPRRSRCGQSFPVEAEKAPPI